jgi:putative ABC transport system permease protein
MVAVLGGLPARFGPSGRLARDNARRNPVRTSVTASALMVGLGLVSAMTVLASSVTLSVDRTIEQSVGADFVVTSTSFTGFSPQVAEALAGVDGVAAVAGLQTLPATIGGTPTLIVATDPTALAKTVTLTTEQGVPVAQAMADGQLAVDSKVAAERGLTLGSSVEIGFDRGPVTLVVGSVFTPSPAAGGGVLISDATAAKATGARPDQFAYVALAPGADRVAVRGGLEEALAGNPSVTLLDQTEFKAENRRQIQTLLGLVSVLLLLAFVIAALGIVNTLALSTLERTREIGLLRAVGTQRRQIRRMIRVEAAIIAVIGSLGGVVLGVALGAAIQRSLRDDGITVLDVPVVQLAAYVVGGLVLGVLAALWPAWRASRMDVLTAIATQ